MCSDSIAIEAKNISKLYSLFDKPLQRLKTILFKKTKSSLNQFVALDTVSFAIKPGETVGIIGENGSGKSTLLQIICNIILPDSGTIKINGRVAALLELGAGFNPNFTGKENVFMNAALLGLTEKEVHHKFQDIINFAEIGEFINQPVKTYSSGMYIRLAFAIAINADPDILIIDEALAVGDARFQSKCFNKINQIKNNGTTILFVSHDISAVKQFCDRVIWLEKGRIKMLGDVLKVTSKYLEYLFDNSEEKNLELAPAIESQKSIEELSLQTADRLPINHWGSAQGCIMSCLMFNQDGKLSKTFVDNELIIVEFRFKIPKNAKPEGFGIAFSIRSLHGTDLIVYDTFSQNIQFDFAQECHQIQFKFHNPLNEDKYILVAVIEDRSTLIPAYYEFIEGIHYFSIIRNKKRFGLFIPTIQHEKRIIDVSA